jgi:hypothetical protein
MLQTEWRFSSNLIPHQVQHYRWLLIHCPDKILSNDEVASDSKDKEDESTDSEEEEDESPNKFGSIPRFSMVYKVTVNPDSLVLSCTCCHQERMGMPCRHIASICRSNKTILGDNPKGFPLSSIRIFWWNKYYLYGMSKKRDHQKIKLDLVALANNDIQGVACPSLDAPSSLLVPDHVFKAFCHPATERLLNYTGSAAKDAVQRMQDRNNRNRLQEAVPPGYSQISHLPSRDSASLDWQYPVEELSDIKDYGHTRKVVSRHYNEATEAIHNSLEKQNLEA